MIEHRLSQHCAGIGRRWNRGLSRRSGELFPLTRIAPHRHARHTDIQLRTFGILLDPPHRRAAEWAGDLPHWSNTRRPPEQIADPRMDAAYRGQQEHLTGASLTEPTTHLLVLLRLQRLHAAGTGDHGVMMEEDVTTTITGINTCQRIAASRLAR